MTLHRSSTGAGSLDLYHSDRDALRQQQLGADEWDASSGTPSPLDRATGNLVSAAPTGLPSHDGLWVNVEGDPLDPGGSANSHFPTPTPPPAPPEPSDTPEVEKTWIAIKLQDDQGTPLGGRPYRIILADGRVRTGKLDEYGTARIDGVAQGECEVSFPEFS